MSDERVGSPRNGAAPPMRRTRYFRDAVAVFEGGGMRALAYAGAISAAHDHGVRFRGAVGASAGSIAATLLCAGFSPSEISTLMRTLDASIILAPPQRLPGERPFRQRLAALCAKTIQHPILNCYVHLGQHSLHKLEDWIETQLRQRLCINERYVLFSDFKNRPLCILATDIKHNRLKLWSTDTSPNDTVSSAVKSSCAIPFFFQPTINDDEILVDGGMLANLPVYWTSVLEGCKHYPVIAFRLQGAHPPGSARTPQPFEALEYLTHTLVSGTTAIQLEMVGPCAHIKIPTGTIKTTQFSLSSEDKATLVNNGYSATHEFFATEDIGGPDVSHSRSYHEIGKKGMWLDHSMRLFDRATQSIQMFGGNCSWVTDLAPCIIEKALSGVKVSVLYDSNREISDARIRTLRAVGCSVKRAPRDLRLRGAIVDAGCANSVVIITNRVADSVDRDTRSGRIFTREMDPALVDTISKYFDFLWSQEDQMLPAHTPELKPLSVESLIEELRSVRQYRDAEISYEAIQPKMLRWITRSILPFKLTRVDFLLRLLDRFKIDLFAPMWLQESAQVIAPPVCEVRDYDVWVLLDGTHRIYHCIENGIESVHGIVVRGVADPLPARVVGSVDEVRPVATSLGRSERFEGYSAHEFRQLGDAYRSLGCKLLSGATRSKAG